MEGAGSIVVNVASLLDTAAMGREKIGSGCRSIA
jgi:hypothetical protein